MNRGGIKLNSCPTGRFSVRHLKSRWEIQPLLLFLNTPDWRKVEERVRSVGTLCRVSGNELNIKPSVVKIWWLFYEAICFDCFLIMKASINFLITPLLSFYLPVYCFPCTDLVATPFIKVIAQRQPL